MDKKTCNKNCKFFKKYKKGQTTDSGHLGDCFNIKAIKMFATEEGWWKDLTKADIKDYEQNGFPVFDVYELQEKECPHYMKK